MAERRRLLPPIGIALAFAVGAVALGPTAANASLASGAPGWLHASIAPSKSGGVWVLPDNAVDVNPVLGFAGATTSGTASDYGTILADPAGTGYYIVEADGDITRTDGVSPWKDLSSTGYDG